jgi:hypothetical protein
MERSIAQVMNAEAPPTAPIKTSRDAKFRTPISRGAFCVRSEGSNAFDLAAKSF